MGISLVAKNSPHINIKEMSSIPILYQFRLFEISKNIELRIRSEHDVIRIRNHAAVCRSPTLVKMFTLTEIKVNSVINMANISVVFVSFSSILLSKVFAI